MIIESKITKVLVCNQCRSDIVEGSKYYSIITMFYYRCFNEVPNDHIPSSRIFCSKECFLESNF